MGKLLKLALDEGRYDLAAYVLVYGLIKATQANLLHDAGHLSAGNQDGRKKHRKGQKAGVLRSGT